MAPNDTSHDFLLSFHSSNSYTVSEIQQDTGPKLQNSTNPICLWYSNDGDFTEFHKIRGEKKLETIGYD